MYKFAFIWNICHTNIWCRNTSNVFQTQSVLVIDTPGIVYSSLAPTSPLLVSDLDKNVKIFLVTHVIIVTFTTGSPILTVIAVWSSLLGPVGLVQLVRSSWFGPVVWSSWFGPVGLVQLFWSSCLVQLVWSSCFGPVVWSSLLGPVGLVQLVWSSWFGPVVWSSWFGPVGLVQLVRSISLLNKAWPNLWPSALYFETRRRFRQHLQHNLCKYELYITLLINQPRSKLQQDYVLWCYTKFL